MDRDQIQHRFIDVRGQKLHVAEIGTGASAVVFIHGFPEIWYSWRHQMVAVASAGFRAIAPDLRGFGSSISPSDSDSDLEQQHKPSFNGFVEDIVSILDSLLIQQVFLVGKDFGSWPAYLLALLHPTRVCGIVSLGVPFFVPNPQRYKDLPEGFYISRWKEPGRAEADFSRYDIKTVWKNIYILFSRSEIPIAMKDKEIMDLVDPSTSLPPWLTDEDLTIYAASYENSGFDSPMQVPYKVKFDEFTIVNPKIVAPVLLIMGGKDYFLKFPGIEKYISSGEARESVAELDIKFLADGNHFMQEQFPDLVNQFIIDFLNKYVKS